MEHLGASGPAVNSPNVDKGIITLAMNINLNSYMESIKNRTLQTLQTFHIITSYYIISHYILPYYNIFIFNILYYNLLYFTY